MDRLRTIVTHVTASGVSTAVLGVSPTLSGNKPGRTPAKNLSKKKRQDLVRAKGEMGNIVVGSRRSAKFKKVTDLFRAKELVKKLVSDVSCAPLLLLLAWHHSGENKPAVHGENATLQRALSDYLEPIKKEVPDVSLVDLIQLASSAGIGVAGGVPAPAKYGRLDAPADVQPALSAAACSSFDRDPAQYLRDVCQKYGLDDRDIVALSGSHTLGKKLTTSTKTSRVGSSILENSSTSGDAESIDVRTDRVFISDSRFKLHFDAFCRDRAMFFEANRVACQKLSMLGTKFDPPQGITM